MKRLPGSLVRAAILVVLAAAGAAATGAPRAGGETALDKYQALLLEKRALRRENWILKQEANLAAARAPYILFDLETRELDFRIRGKTLKSYTFSAVSYRERGHDPADPEVVWRILDGPLTVLEKEGGQQEIVPSESESGDGEAPGTEEELSDAALLGVQAPTEYFIKFEEDVVFHIRSESTRTFREIAVKRLGEIARAVGSLVTGGSSDGEEPRVSLYLTTDDRTAQHLYYSLLPGERIFVTPPSPPPVILVATKNDSAP